MNRRQFLVGSAVGAGIIAGTTGAYGALVETQQLVVTHAARNDMLGIGARIVQISDLHLHGLTAVHDKLARTLGELRPDVVIISGDTIDRRSHLTMLRDLLQMLPRVPHVLATLGNWEHQADVPLRPLTDVYAHGGVDLLINRRVELQGRKARFTISGLDDSTAGTPDMRMAQRANTPTICIAHSPAFRDMLLSGVADAKQLPDLMLSGHTHGGQITFFGWAPVRPRGSGRYLYGWYGRKSLPLFVSRGIGTTSIPVRLGAVPEVVVFDV